MPVVRSKGCKSKTNRHKHNNTKQDGELKPRELHSMQTEQSKRYFQTLETRPPTFQPTTCFPIALYTDVSCEKAVFTPVSPLFFLAQKAFLDWRFYFTHFVSIQTAAIRHFFKQPVFLLCHYLSCCNTD